MINNASKFRQRCISLMIGGMWPIYTILKVFLMPSTLDERCLLHKKQ